MVADRITTVVVNGVPEGVNLSDWEIENLELLESILELWLLKSTAAIIIEFREGSLRRDLGAH